MSKLFIDNLLVLQEEYVRNQIDSIRVSLKRTGRVEVNEEIGSVM